MGSFIIHGDGSLETLDRSKRKARTYSPLARIAAKIVPTWKEDFGVLAHAIGYHDIQQKKRIAELEAELRAVKAPLPRPWTFAGFVQAFGFRS